MLALGSSSAEATSRPAPSGIDSANKLFQDGKFPEAGEPYSRIAAQQPQDYSAVVQLGRIALLSNQLTDAQKWLGKALALQPGDTDAKVMLAEAFYRGDDFQKAAGALDGVTVTSNKLVISQYPTLNTAKLASFKGQTPYEVHGNRQVTRLTFLKTDPLPAVSTLRFRMGESTPSLSATGPLRTCLS